MARRPTDHGTCSVADASLRRAAASRDNPVANQKGSRIERWMQREAC